MARKEGTGSAAATRWLGGIAELARRFDGFILDQWGVLHDGVRAYPGVREALEALRRHGKRLVVLSNSARRRARAEQTLAALGIDPKGFDAIVTSGELAWRALKEGRIAELHGCGRRCLLIMREGDRSVVEGLDLHIVEDPDEADFLFISGIDTPQARVEDYRPLLEAAARRGLVAICSNPDLLAPSPAGLLPAPGALAQLYRRLGGRVVAFGKPDPRAVESCLAALAPLPRGKVVLVGDSLTHDIRAAAAADIASCLVTGGLHREVFRTAAPEQALARLAAEVGVRPAFAMPAFRW